MAEITFDVNNFQQSLMKFAQFAQTPIAFALSYNNLGFNMELVPGHNMWDQLGIKFINILTYGWQTVNPENM